MSLHSGLSNDNPLSTEELFDLISVESLTEITNRINNEKLLPHDALNELLTYRNNFQLSSTDFSVILGRLDILKVLVAKGSDLNSVNASGYSPAHFAVCWRRYAELKFLYERGANLHLTTARNEDTLQIALRYGYDDIKDFLEWAYARDSLIKYLTETRNMVNTADKSKISKDDKKLCDSVCNDKENWIKNNTEATIQDFYDKLEESRNMMNNVWTKLNEVVEEP